MDGGAEDELLAVELEALAATHGEEVQIAGRCASVSLAPHTGQDEFTRFVEAKLTLMLPAGYPEVPPRIKLACKGLGDMREQQLRQLLEKEAEQLRGELVLGHLCEV